MIKELKGRHVAFILMGMFGTIFAVNGVFAYFAVSGFPGLETQGAYRKGLAFNAQIERSEVLKTLGWTMSADRSGSDRLTLRFTGKTGEALRVSGVEVTLFHPTYARGDKNLTVTAQATGIVVAALDPLEKGQRQLRIQADGPDGRRIEFRRSIWLD
jgi:nitrogen fixation protein FixH